MVIPILYVVFVYLIYNVFLVCYELFAWFAAQIISKPILQKHKYIRISNVEPDVRHLLSFNLVASCCNVTILYNFLCMCVICKH